MKQKYFVVASLLFVLLFGLNTQLVFAQSFDSLKVVRHDSLRIMLLGYKGGQKFPFSILGSAPFSIAFEKDTLHVPAQNYEFSVSPGWSVDGQITIYIDGRREATIDNRGTFPISEGKHEITFVRTNNYGTYYYKRTFYVPKQKSVGIDPDEWKLIAPSQRIEDILK